MLISAFSPDQLGQQEVDRLLFRGLADDGAVGDLILVFGSRRCLQYRLPHAIELYQAKRAPILLLSGGNKWGEPSISEAELMKSEALKHGVPESAIWTEAASVHTKQNAQFSRAVIEERIGWANVKRVLLVSSGYHMRRCQLNLLTYWPDSIAYTFCPVDDQLTRRDNWFLNEKGTSRAKEECTKLIKYVKANQLLDVDIP